MHRRCSFSEAPRSAGGLSVLQGTFETLSLPEVLGLLASARKSGALRLEAGPVAGVVHLVDGHCRAVETPEQRSAVAGAPELLLRLVDVCFAVTRQESGGFRFAADEPAPWSCAEPVELSDALVEVDRLLKQWREILRVIPSLDCKPMVHTALEADEVVLDREHWALLVTIDGDRTVRELVQLAARPLLDVCHALLELVEAGAIGVIDPDTPRPALRPEPAAVEPSVPEPPTVERTTVAPLTVDPVAVEPVSTEPVAADPGPDGPAPVPVEPSVAATPAAIAVDAVVSDAVVSDATVSAAGPPVQNGHGAEAGSEAPDKGAFLRLFSGLRDT